MTINSINHKIEGIFNDFELLLIEKHTALALTADLMTRWTLDILEHQEKYLKNQYEMQATEHKRIGKIILTATGLEHSEKEGVEVKDLVKTLKFQLNNFKETQSVLIAKEKVTPEQANNMYKALQRMLYLMLKLQQYEINKI